LGLKRTISVAEKNADGANGIIDIAIAGDAKIGDGEVRLAVTVEVSRRDSLSIASDGIFRRFDEDSGLSYR
jgi:ABC-type uncharacterized transport system ATPase subunit